MTPAELDKIVAAHERTGHVRAIPQDQRIAATARALGIPEARVRKALALAEAEK